jgi:flagellar M-ring protein FliF
VTAPGTGGAPGAYQPRAPEEMQRIEQLVRSAVGYDANRGDQVSVVNVQFNRTADAAGGTEAANPLMGFDKNDIMRTAELGVLALVAALLIFFVARPLLKGAGPPPAVTPVLVGSSAALPAPSASMAYDAAGEGLALPAPDVDATIDIAKIEGQVRASSVKKVSEFVERHPEASISIIRNWLHETP